MKEKIISKIMKKIKNNNPNIDNIKFEEIKYGLYGIYTLITKSFIITVIAIILGIVNEFIIFLILYSILRSVGFGTHAKNNISCWLFSTILLIGLPYIFSIIKLTTIVKVIIWSACFINFFIFCPADTEKRPIISKKRKIVFKFCLLTICLIYLFIILRYNNISNLVIGSMLLECLLTNPLGYILMGQKIRFKLNDIFKFKQE